VTEARFLMAYDMAKYDKPFSYIEFVKQWMLDAKRQLAFP
jgi:hypothetical protein